MRSASSPNGSPTSVSKKLIKTPKGIQQLISDDPAQMLLYAVEAVQPATSYMRLRRVLRKQNKRDATVGWIHVTGALKDCDRAIAAQLLGYHLPRRAEEPKGYRILENGSYMHLRWQNTFMQLPKKVFQVQIARMLREWPLVGEADIWLDHEEFGPTIVELKSINSNGFRERGKEGRPRDDHFYQANLYAGLSESPSVQVWYENKDNQDTHTFYEPFDEGHYLGVRERVIDLAKKTAEGRLPPPCEGECEFDDFVGNIDLDESMMSLLAQEMSEWQKSRRP